MKNYLLFRFDVYSSQGGMHDLKDSFDDLHAAYTSAMHGAEFEEIGWQIFSIKHKELLGSSLMETTWEELQANDTNWETTEE